MSHAEPREPRRSVFGSMVAGLGGLAAGAFLAPRQAEAQTRVTLADLQNQIADLQADLAETQLELAGQVATKGTFFTRWGATAAPPGTELIRSGLAFISNYAHSGGPSEPFIVGPPDSPGTSQEVVGAAYPLSTLGASSSLPPGILPNRRLLGAVCRSFGPTTVIWGTHVAPAGYRALYTGYGMASHYTHSQQFGPILVDHVAFDASMSVSNFSNGAGLAYAVTLNNAAFAGYSDRAFLKGVCVTADDYTEEA